MKILLAVRDSACGDVAAREVVERRWPAGSEVRIVSVVHPYPFIPEPTFTGIAAHYQSLIDERERAAADVARVARLIAERAPGLRVTTTTLEGAPAKRVVEEARRWAADLMVVGSHEHWPAYELPHRSVTRASVAHAPS